MVHTTHGDDYPKPHMLKQTSNACTMAIGRANNKSTNSNKDAENEACTHNNMVYTWWSPGIRAESKGGAPKIMPARDHKSEPTETFTRNRNQRWWHVRPEHTPSSTFPDPYRTMPERLQRAHFCISIDPPSRISTDHLWIAKGSSGGKRTPARMTKPIETTDGPRYTRLASTRRRLHRHPLR